MVSFPTMIGFINADAPKTTIKLKRFDPTTLLTASALLFDNEAVTETASSGKEVPIATMVRPIIMLGTFNAFATEEEPSTKKSAPFNKRTNPTNNKTITFKASIIPPLRHTE